MINLNLHRIERNIVMLNDVLPLLNSILKYNFFRFFERYVLFNIKSLSLFVTFKSSFNIIQSTKLKENINKK